MRLQTAGPSHPAYAGISLSTLQVAALAFMIGMSWFVVVEPAPYELLFALCLLLFLPVGLAVSRFILPLMLLLIIYNMGGIASLMPVLYDDKAVMFVFVSIYMAVTSIFFAAATAYNPTRIMAVIRPAYVVAAVIGSILGMIGYFDIAGMGGAWAPISRAQGTFKDPNVLSTFLIPPALFLIQDFVLKQQRNTILSGLALLIIVAGLFLAFSRGAWGNMAGSTLLMLLITFIISPSSALRSRIVLLTISGIIGVICLVLFALSFEAVQTIFVQRASLVQSYDGGATGRFANQLNSLPLLMLAPNGMGPMQFRHIFGEDPHNVYINAFAAYGWTGGIAYLLLIGSTIAAGWRAVFTVSPHQHHAIVIFCPLFMTTLQGIQIDTDHWRHFYLLLGLMWGLFAATQMYTFARHRPATSSR